MKALSPLISKLYSSHVTAPIEVFDTDSAWHKDVKATTNFSSNGSLILAKEIESILESELTDEFSILIGNEAGPDVLHTLSIRIQQRSYTTRAITRYFYA